jgi:hypothetical protein
MSIPHGASVLEKKSSTVPGAPFQSASSAALSSLGEKSWRPGTTENISRSGLLFQAQELLHPNALLEISLVLPRRLPDWRRRK